MFRRNSHPSKTSTSLKPIFDVVGAGIQVVAILLAFIAIAVTSARAQEFRGTLSGTVTDPSGASIKGATVTVKESQTGTVNATVSDAAGQYVIPFLLPGNYSITAAAKGFENEKLVSRPI